LLRADDIRLVGTTCCESVGLIKLVTTELPEKISKDGVQCG
jgi:hypothetical protein